MARKNAKTEEKKNYLEFDVKGVDFNYSGRIYIEGKTETAKCEIIPMTLTLNNKITIRGCKLFRTDKNSWISGPSYKAKDGEYKDYLYIDKDANDEIDALVSTLEDLIDNN